MNKKEKGGKEVGTWMEKREKRARDENDEQIHYSDSTQLDHHRHHEDGDDSAAASDFD